MKIDAPAKIHRGRGGRSTVCIQAGGVGAFPCAVEKIKLYGHAGGDSGAPRRWGARPVCQTSSVRANRGQPRSLDGERKAIRYRIGPGGLLETEIRGKGLHIDLRVIPSGRRLGCSPIGQTQARAAEFASSYKRQPCGRKATAEINRVNGVGRNRVETASHIADGQIWRRGHGFKRSS